MEKLTKELIIRDMEGIRKEDLQRRLKFFYTKREQIINVRKKRERLPDDFSILEYNYNLQIEVYEEVLPIETVERAKRSASMYDTPEKYATSVERENTRVER